MDIRELFFSNYIFITINIILILIIIFLFINIKILKENNINKEKNEKLKNKKKRFNVNISWKEYYDESIPWGQIKNINISENIKKVNDIDINTTDSSNDIINSNLEDTSIIKEFNAIAPEKKYNNNYDNEVKETIVSINKIESNLESNNFSNKEILYLLKKSKKWLENFSKNELNRFWKLKEILKVNSSNIDLLINDISEKIEIDKQDEKKVTKILKNVNDLNLSIDDMERYLSLKKLWKKNISEKDKVLLENIDQILGKENISYDKITTLINKKKNSELKIKKRVNEIWQKLLDNNLSNDEVVRLLILRKSWDKNISDSDRKKLEILDNIIWEEKLSDNQFQEIIDLKIKKDAWVIKKTTSVKEFLKRCPITIKQINKLCDLKKWWYTNFSQDELNFLSDIEDFFALNFLTQDDLNDIINSNKSIEASIMKNLDIEIHNFLEKLWISWSDLLRLFNLKEKKYIKIHPKDKIKIDEIDSFISKNTININDLKETITTKYKSYIEWNYVNFDNYINNYDFWEDISKDDYSMKKYKTF